MDNRYSKFAPWALGLSGIGLLASLGLYFVYRAFELPVQISIAVTVIGAALFIYLDPDRARSLFTGRQARYGSNALVLTIAFVGILVVVNYLIFQNGLDWGLRWDLTEDQEESLSEETIEALEALDRRVQVTAFFTFNSAPARERAVELLDDFRVFARNNLVYEVIDPNNDPFAAQTAGITRDATVVFELDGNRELVTVISEQQYANAIIRLLNPGDKGVYFISGHGEPSLDQASEFSITQLKRKLEEKNYVVGSISLLSGSPIPRDAEVLIISSPTRPFAEGEIDLVRAFVNAGGSLIVSLDPALDDAQDEADDLLAAFLLEEWKIEVRNDLVIEPDSIGIFGSPYVAVSIEYLSHPIVDDLNNPRIDTYYNIARSVTTSVADIASINHSPLVQTSAQSWGETDIAALNAGEVPNIDPETEAVGPLSLGIAAENIQTGARAVVFGDGDFYSDSHFSNFGNGDLIANAVDWVVAQDELITITPRERTQRFVIPLEGSTVNLLFLGTICLLPGLALIGGVAVYINRRRRG